MHNVELQRGQVFFGGNVLSSSVQSGITVAQVEYPEAKRCHRHGHERAFFALLLEGAYSEKSASANMSYRPFRLGFHPRATSHLDEVGVPRTRFLIIELADHWINRIPDSGSWAESSPQLCNAHGSWLAAGLDQAIRGSDADFELRIEAGVLEMLATIVPSCRD